jgi:acetyl-CoA carboxylase carboxyltransferase component
MSLWRCSKNGIHQGKQCIVVANDATVKRVLGSQLLLRKIFAQRNRHGKSLPIIYLVDSAGVYLPLQDEIFPDKEHFGRIFRNNAQMSMGLPNFSNNGKLCCRRSLPTYE